MEVRWETNLALSGNIITQNCEQLMAHSLTVSYLALVRCSDPQLLQ